jgi:flavin-dependent dehydrogenase
MNAIDKTGQMSEGLSYGIKSAELLGKTKDEAAYRNYMNNFVKAQQVVGKTITPEQQYEFAKFARAAGPQLSDRFISTTGVSLAQEMGDLALVTLLISLASRLLVDSRGRTTLQPRSLCALVWRMKTTSKRRRLVKLRE